MTPLGNIRIGVRKIANKAASLTYHNGQVALFVGRNGETAAVLWYEPGYEHAVSHRHDLWPACTGTATSPEPRTSPSACAMTFCR